MTEIIDKLKAAFADLQDALAKVDAVYDRVLEEFKSGTITRDEAIKILETVSDHEAAVEFIDGN